MTGIVIFTALYRTAFPDYCPEHFFWARPTRFFLLVFRIFVSLQCWPSRQLLIARKSTVSYRIVLSYTRYRCCKDHDASQRKSEIENSTISPAIPEPLEVEDLTFLVFVDVFNKQWWADKRYLFYRPTEGRRLSRPGGVVYSSQISTTVFHYASVILSAEQVTSS